MTRLIFLTLLQFSFTIGVFSQHSVIKSEENNPFFRYDIRIYKSFQWSDDFKVTGFEIDTFNVCRIKQTKLKSLLIYYFENKKDSVLHQSFEYNINGLIMNMNPVIGWYSLAKINPDTVYIDCSSFKVTDNKKYTGTINKKNWSEKVKEIYHYDSLGYQIEYTLIKLGVFNRWATRTIGGGTVIYQTFYNYSNNYKSVRISRCYSSRLKSNDCTELYYDFIDCIFDTNGNIMSEFKYKIKPNGETVIVDGYKYYYDYFE